MNMLKVLIVLLMSLSGCSDRKPLALETLDNMELTAARSRFQTLPIKEQVEIVSWELNNRRPASSRFDFLLSQNGPDAAPALLAEATKTKSLAVNITMLTVYSKTPRGQSEDFTRLAIALERCYELAGKQSTECDTLNEELKP